MCSAFTQLAVGQVQLDRTFMIASSSFSAAFAFSSLTTAAS